MEHYFGFGITPGNQDGPQCMDICSMADSRFKENISIIENYATADAVQFMVLTHSKTI
jgi:hypothetical protein